ncbi:MAG: hypothetical protein KF729_01150 [Sandaracinaceae bacterium]|nr:hypothetical protein [Sandaracinaceae bacterium]
MNFFGHAAVAAWTSDEPRWVLGAMLPDLVSMCRARIADVEDEAVRAGVALHHRTDDAFHGAPTFVALQRDGIDALEAAGVGRGAARAVAHVGPELLIDGLLLDDPAACAAYAGAVAFEGALGLRFARGGERFEALRREAATRGLPNDLRAPPAVAARLERVLARRPRLALVAADAAPVTRWLAGARVRLERDLGRLLEEVHARLHAVDTEASARAILPRRDFPHLRGSQSV